MKLIKITLTIALAMALFASFAEAWRRRLSRRRTAGGHIRYIEKYCKIACGEEEGKYEKCVCNTENEKCQCDHTIYKSEEHTKLIGVGTKISVNWRRKSLRDMEDENEDDHGLYLKDEAVLPVSRRGNLRTQDLAENNEENIPCDWNWSECSATCGEGIKKSVVLWKSDDDTTCNPPKEMPCNLKPCE